ncbi:triphosphoribosyl-dephospho-CoA synthase [Aquabacterium sp.]|uniref:triphosphoribosyl-dephospho-CoA synthase n=1 Tax=Aquabacterium sp. TaxID=1872578 RepID=UPI0037835AF6
MIALACTPAAADPAAGDAPWARAFGRAATLALYDELALSPKPGLVTLQDSGSHADMDAQTFLRSLFALRGYFGQIAGLGARGAAFAELERCGRQAEQRMLAATGGINTHRGAIFSLGLVCAAAAAAWRPDRGCDAAAVRARLLSHWGAALRQRALRPSPRPGGLAAARHGLRSASAEAALGFPALFDTVLPAYQAELGAGAALASARRRALFRLILALDDANLAHRGGLEGLRFARAAAAGYLATHGVHDDEEQHAARAIGRAFVARRLSPGGAADMLAVLCFLQRIGVVQAAA